MKLIVFGASGNVGQHLVRLGRDRGHTVTAVVRDGTRFEPPIGVQVVRGDVLDAAFVAQVVRGHDLVTSALGMRYKHPWAKRESPDDFVPRATENLIAAMKAAGLRRISIVSAAGAGDSRPGMNWPMRLILATSNVGIGYAGLDRAEAALKGSGLQWQAVRPVTLTHKPAKHAVRLLPNYPATATISREDVAEFMLQELESEHFSQPTPLIAA